MKTLLALLTPLTLSELSLQVSSSVGPSLIGLAEEWEWQLERSWSSLQLSCNASHHEET
jgi:hypothetical protein